MTGQATFSLADEDLAAVSLDWAFLAAALSPEPLLLLESEVEEGLAGRLVLVLVPPGRRYWSRSGCPCGRNPSP